MGIDWKPTFKTGNAPMDVEHQQWLDRANSFLNASDEFERLAAALQLRDYTVLHFRHEENLMHQVQYPDITTHVRHHAETLIHMNLLIRQLQSGAANLEKWQAFLQELFTRHIGAADLKLAAFFTSQKRRMSGRS